MTKKLTNGFATKKDIQHLEKKMDRRFEQVDKRFEQVDKRFGQVNDQFKYFREEMKEDWNFFKSDTFREFEHKWQQKIDPILAEIEKHRDNEVIMAEQYHRLESLMIKVADKVGVEVTD
ncbi:MAG: hypothetical protein AAB430_02580 [Patescibacteria group bacterium]